MGYVANCMMNVEVENLTGAAHVEQSVSRINQRNGYRGRAWETRVGTLELEIPKAPEGRPLPDHPRAAACLGESIRAAYVQGLSTRPVDDLAKAMSMTGITYVKQCRCLSKVEPKVRHRLWQGDKQGSYGGIAEQ